MPLLDLHKLTVGLSRVWARYLRDWDRSLRSGNYPETTRYNYLLAAAQLARYLGEFLPDPDADAGASDPAEVTRAHVEAFQAWMIETRSASTALNKHKGLQQFFRWLQGDEQAIERSPMERVRPPKTPTKLVRVLREADTAKVLEACRGKGFVGLRDEALIRLQYQAHPQRLAGTAHPGAGAAVFRTAMGRSGRRIRRRHRLARRAVAAGAPPVPDGVADTDSRIATQVRELKGDQHYASLRCR
jgi:Phage integrase, N-terminal SAM-like domain